MSYGNLKHDIKQISYECVKRAFGNGKWSLYPGNHSYAEKVNNVLLLCAHISIINLTKGNTTVWERSVSYGSKIS